MSKYGLKEYKELLERVIVEYGNPMNVPFGMDPYSQEAIAYRQYKREAYTYALEMLPVFE